MKDFNAKDFTVNRIIVNKKCGNIHVEEIENSNFKTEYIKAFDNDQNGSVLQVFFKNETFVRKYHLKIEKFLSELLEEGEEFIVYRPSYNSEKEYEDSSGTFRIDKIDRDCLTNGTNVKENVPHYLSEFSDTLQSIETKIPEKVEEEKISMFTCFNCLGSHHMKECPEKLDYSRININKKDILAGNSIRYHNDEPGNTFAPGKFSKELCDALELKQNQLPLFIYHMRVIGYPPGWMEEAIFERSGLSVYGSEGKAITDRNAVPPPVNGTLYDGTKFIVFPGFNSQVPDGFLDEWKNLKMPPLQTHQQLKEALKSPNIIISSTIYKRRTSSSEENGDMKKYKNGENSCHTHQNEVSKSNSSTSQRNKTTCGFKTPDSKHHSISVSISPGTPILAQGNPFQKLPEAEKFAEGITEHLPFENLADSVGKYEKMRGVISGVQKKLSDIKNS